MDLRGEIKKFMNGGMPESVLEEKELGTAGLRTNVHVTS